MLEFIIIISFAALLATGYLGVRNFCRWLNKKIDECDKENDQGRWYD